jgi:hypothetical protein
MEQVTALSPSKGVPEVAAKPPQALRPIFNLVRRRDIFAGFGSANLSPEMARFSL